jgi:thiamine-monophosphate kinase
LALSIQIMGEVPTGQALRRDGAKVGDEVWVSGRLGDAALALAHLQGRVALSPEDAAASLPALHTPQPRVALGLALLGVAHSAIDISDGLLADLGHILESSQAGARIEFDSLPASDAMARHLHEAAARDCLLAGGDDYELCFTAPRNRHGEVLEISRRLGLPLTPIGEIVAGEGLAVLDREGRAMSVGAKGFDHFA